MFLHLLLDSFRSPSPLLQREVEDMIWEVDENLDGCVDLEEFQLMFKRNIADKTQLEPFQLFNVVQFCMYDKDFSGRVSVDETMHMLFARHGKEKLESEMRVSVRRRRRKQSRRVSQAPSAATAPLPSFHCAHYRVPTLLPPLPLFLPLQRLFGNSLSAEGNGTLSFLDYLKAVNKRTPVKMGPPGSKSAADKKGGRR